MTPHDLVTLGRALGVPLRLGPLRAGEGAYLRGDSVLAMLSLADVNPRKIRVVAPNRTRARMPALMEVTAPPRGEAPNLTRYEGLLAMRVADAILDCQGRIQRDRLLQAARDARKEGLVTRAEYSRLERELRKPTPDPTKSTNSSGGSPTPHS